MKKKKQNKFDLIIEKLADNFSKVENFNKLFESEEGIKLFDLIVKQTSEIDSFEALFLNYYIPASNKAVVDGWKQISTSKYKHLLSISKEDLKENVYEIIRLGYVGLFHKYEAYLKALIDATNFLMRELNEENKLLNIEEYCKKEFETDIFKSHNKFDITKRINYISNCVKHYDGYPLKEPIHEDFTFFDKNEKIKITKEIFKIDIDRLKIHNQSLLSQILMLGFKQFMDLEYEEVSKSFKPELKRDDDLKMKYEKLKKDFDLLFADFLK